MKPLKLIAKMKHVLGFLNFQLKRDGPAILTRRTPRARSLLKSFFADDDIVDWDRFKDIGIVKWQGVGENIFDRAQAFLNEYQALRISDNWQRSDVVDMIKKACPTLSYIDTGKFLSGRM